MGCARYSIENPLAYIESNIVGFAHILKDADTGAVLNTGLCKQSSACMVPTPLCPQVCKQMSTTCLAYMLGKKSNELMAHTHSVTLYGLSSTGLSFSLLCTLWGRPDMVLFQLPRQFYG